MLSSGWGETNLVAFDVIGIEVFVHLKLGNYEQKAVGLPWLLIETFGDLPSLIPISIVQTSLVITMTWC